MPVRPVQLKSPYMGLFTRSKENPEGVGRQEESVGKWALGPFFVSGASRRMTNREVKLSALFEPVIRAMGYELWGLEYLGQGRHTLLRVYLDRESGIDVEDCALVSRQLSAMLDVEDPISGEYTLEVSSPGLDRPLFTLAQFERYVGHQAKIRLRQSFDNRRNFAGLLLAVENEEVKLIIGDEEYSLPFELIEKANIVPQL